MAALISAQAYDDLLAEIGAGVPNAEQHLRMGGLALDLPEARALAAMDPFSPAYRDAALALYLTLRGRPEEGYLAARDERPSAALPENLWTGLVPWSFHDVAMTGEHLMAWGHIMSHMRLPVGGSVLEYGPGSGQLLLSLARMGYRACGVDIDALALEGIRAQSAALSLGVETEQAEFGRGFEGQHFDCVLFYEAFHEAFDFEALLLGLRDRLKPGGRLILCGEPILPAAQEILPYPWGPRLDALSVFCVRRFGWMELGFTQDFFLQIANRTGWAVTFHPFAVGRAHLYVLERQSPVSRGPSNPACLSGTCEHAPASPLETGTLLADLAAAKRERDEAKQMLMTMKASNSWRVTGPLRRLRQMFAKDQVHS